MNQLGALSLILRANPIMFAGKEQLIIFVAVRFLRCNSFNE